MSNNGRLKVVPSVFTLIEKDGKVLLLRRANTGYADGWYDLPAGHLEDQEKLADGAARELKEEAGITVMPEDLKLLHVHQNHNDEPAHYGFIFLASKWSGKPKIMETDKCDDMNWFAPSDLPAKTLPYTRDAIMNLNSPHVVISYHAPDSVFNLS